MQRWGWSLNMTPSSISSSVVHVTISDTSTTKGVCDGSVWVDLPLRLTHGTDVLDQLIWLGVLQFRIVTVALVVASEVTLAVRCPTSGD